LAGSPTAVAMFHPTENCCKLSPKPSIEQKQKAGKTGFVPVQARWVIERSNSWIERCKSLVKNFERTLAHATTKVNLCFVRLMLQRLATG